MAALTRDPGLLASTKRRSHS